MRDLDIKRLNALTDELERRIKILESKKTEKKQSIPIIEEISEGLLFRPENNVKRFEFKALNSTYAVLKVEISSPLTNAVICEIYCNGELQKQVKSTFPLECALPIKTVKGENQVKIKVINEQSTASFKLDIKLTIQGEVEEKPIKYRLGNLIGEMSYIKYGSSAICFNSETLEPIICYTDRDVLGVGCLKLNYVAILVKDENGTRFLRHERNFNTPYKTEVLDEEVLDCDVDVHNGVIYLYILNGNDAYIFGYMSDGYKFKEKLPFNAAKIGHYNGTTGRYIFYTDLKGVVNVIKHKSYKSYDPIESISLGKLENANICEENGELIVTYKQGVFVMKKPVFRDEAPSVMGIGDEGIISNLGYTIIRQKNKIIKL